MVKYLRISSYTLGSPALNMTSQPIPSEFPYTVYEENLVFFFISVWRSDGRWSSPLHMVKEDSGIYTQYVLYKS
jgi:hypothetical protein